MIDLEYLFNENIMGLICPDGLDATDLIHIAGNAAAKKISVISAGPESVECLWTWLEKKPARILARFFIEMPKKTDFVQEISSLSEQINFVFKKGAAGAQVFVPHAVLESFINELLPVRDGLFFNKDLCVGMDINGINAGDWTDVFANLKKMKADALLLYLSQNRKGNPDFVGRIYGLLENFDFEFNGHLHFMLGNDYARIEQTWRLINKMRHEIAGRIRFFV
ncbi:MAG: hypothetical protein LBF28_01145 [Rickettsiales bacterium]|jgi:hypothetical protein|nr:hypothetical protein [Rickettsiales bacterium]